MPLFAVAVSTELQPESAADRLRMDVEDRLAEIGPTASEPAGALVLTNWAAGDSGPEVGEALARAWPAAAISGAVFEGLIAEGRQFSDQPATLVLAWQSGPAAPRAFLLEPEIFREADPATLEGTADWLAELRGSQGFGADDRLVFFPDAVEASALEPGLAALRAHLGPVAVAGAACGGAEPAFDVWSIDGGTAHSEPGGTLGLILPGFEGAATTSAAPDGIERVGGSRAASPWLRVGRARSRWVDELDGEPALDWVRRQLGLEASDPVEPHLDRLLIRCAPVSRCVEGEPEAPLEYVERYVVGIDAQRGAFSIPAEVERGAQLALALPDAERAREGLREAVARLATGPALLQLGCRARDETLHGDADLEAAVVAAAVPASSTPFGVVAPFLLAGDRAAPARQWVHSTLLVSLGAGIARSEG